MYKKHNRKQLKIHFQELLYIANKRILLRALCMIYRTLNKPRETTGKHIKQKDCSMPLLFVYDNVSISFCAAM